ncbi:hypothetical protein [Photobacterium leiognathi]|uniref:hypothetical protein n=1 Tax=Photobacterium leiognathi TaxID=553611 RepID=UPI0029819DE4|nr:hypothetical protein [Photobacterium leiognathi]
MKHIEKLDQKRVRVIATIHSFSLLEINQQKRKSVVVTLSNVYLAGGYKKLANQLTMNMVRSFDKFDVGDTIKFDATLEFGRAPLVSPLDTIRNTEAKSSLFRLVRPSMCTIAVRPS